MDSNDLIEAIEDGKIVRVSEQYARREGLPILRRQPIERPLKTVISSPLRKKILEEETKKHPLDLIRKKPDWKEKQVISELIDNFNWVIKFERRKKGLTRTQLAKLIGESENKIKMIELGVLPSPDFQLLNKIQKALGINLRKDGKSFEEVEELLSKAKLQQMEKQGQSSQQKILGKDIEILDEE